MRIDGVRDDVIENCDVYHCWCCLELYDNSLGPLSFGPVAFLPSPPPPLGELANHELKPSHQADVFSTV